MTDNYSIPLNTISLRQFQQMLEGKKLQPGRVMLREEINERFALIEAAGIDDLQALHEALRTKKRLRQFVERTGLPEEFVTLLRREVNSYISKPIALQSFPDVDPVIVGKLADAGIKTTKQLFDEAETPAKRNRLARRLDLPDANLTELTHLADLARILGIGPVSARLLYDAGIDSVASFVKAPVGELVDMLNRSMKAHPQIPTTTVTEKDIVYCMDSARLLPLVAEFD